MAHMYTAVQHPPTAPREPQSMTRMTSSVPPMPLAPMAGSRKRCYPECPGLTDLGKRPRIEGNSPQPSGAYSAIIKQGKPANSDERRFTGKMTVSFIKDEPFRSHIRMKMQEKPLLNIEEFVKSCMKKGASFRKTATSTMQEWEELGRLEDFLRDNLTWADLGSYPALLDYARTISREHNCPNNPVYALLAILHGDKPMCKAKARECIKRVVTSQHTGQTGVDPSPPASVPNVSNGDDLDAPAKAERGFTPPADETRPVNVRPQTLASGFPRASSVQPLRPALAGIRPTQGPTNGRSSAKSPVQFGGQPTNGNPAAAIVGQARGSYARAPGMNGHALPHMRPNGAASPRLLVRDLSESDKMAQMRYFGIVDQQAPARCLNCARTGHLQSACPRNNCRHCKGRHPASACPSNPKCGSCRERGHRAANCHDAPASGRQMADVCEVCQEPHHVEANCPRLGCTYTNQGSKPSPAPKLKISCYNCGSSYHWGDDCPDLPSFLRGVPGTWSAKGADAAIGKQQNTVAQPVQPVQPAMMLDDTRDY